MRLPVRCRDVHQIRFGFRRPARFPHHHVPHRHPLHLRRGVTLIEMLVSVTLTLMIVFAIVQVFDLLGDNVTNTRAIIEMSGQLRSVANQLQSDFDGITVPVRPPADPDGAPGYFEILEGWGSDKDPDGTSPEIAAQIQSSNAFNPDGTISEQLLPPGVDPSVGDIDDVLAFTTRSRGEPYVGRIDRATIPARNDHERQIMMTGMIESKVAEVIWWVQAERNLPDDLTALQSKSVAEQLQLAVDPTRIARYANNTPIRSLHRRALLVRPDLDEQLQSIKISPDRELAKVQIASFFNNNDISARVERLADGTMRLRANSLADLTNRESRFAHRYTPPENDRFPYPMDNSRQDPPGDDLVDNVMSADNWILQRGSLKNLLVGGKDNMRRGEDIKLSDVLAFDVRVYDPTAPVVAAGGVALNPGDPGYSATGTVIGRGGFVDLGYDPGATTQSVYSSLPLWEGWVNRVKTYCTWSTHYERDGIDQDIWLQKKDPWRVGPDQGTNGLDDNNQGGVDDITERETTPPYSAPLRGISVSIRMLEFNTRQVRQISVATDFLPE